MLMLMLMLMLDFARNDKNLTEIAAVRRQRDSSQAMAEPSLN